jgi:alanine-synthesizing transaminase
MFSCVVFSRRSATALDKNAIASALARNAPRFDLSCANPTQTSLPYPYSEIMGALDNAAVRGYAPDPHGLLAARSAIAARISERGVSVTPEQVTLASGTSEAYGYLFKLLCDAGDEVLIPEPSYPLFTDLCRLEHVSTRPYPLSYDGEWHIDMAELKAQVTERTRAILLVSPNNPTGSYIKQHELTQLEGLGLPLISDEVFGDYPLRDDPTRVRTLLESRNALVFALDGLSKQAALPQWKVAWICASGPRAPLAEARARLEMIADTYLSVATPTQLALPRWLELSRPVRAAIQARLHHNLQQLTAAVATCHEVSLLDVEGGFYATLRVPNVQSEERWVLELLQRDGVYVQPGYFFDFAKEAYLVVSLLTPETTFAAGIERLLARVVLTVSSDS